MLDEVEEKGKKVTPVEGVKDAVPVPVEIINDKRPDMLERRGLTTQNIVALTAGIVALISALFAGTVTILQTMRETKTMVTNIEDKGVQRDVKLDEIHVLVNSRLSAVLRMLVATLKKEAERTKDPVDVVAYETALKELDIADAGQAQATKDKESKLDEADMADKRAKRK